MKKLFVPAALAAGMLLTVSSSAMAGPIEKACMRSDRGGNRALCGCIQQVADMTLKGSDQRRASKFFVDPNLAHETWISQRASDDAFWERYKQFGSMAESYCGG